MILILFTKEKNGMNDFTFLADEAVFWLPFIVDVFCLKGEYILGNMKQYLLVHR